MSALPIVSFAISTAFLVIAEAYITDMPTYRKKITETIRYGGDQLLLQGGHHPELGLGFLYKHFPADKAGISCHQTACTRATRSSAYHQTWKKAPIVKY